MNTVGDFEDMLALLQKHKVRYLIIGGLAFIYHAKPRYTKDMDLWIDHTSDNVARANRALADFGSPISLDAHKPQEILQLGIAPDRIDIFLRIPGAKFGTAWEKRVVGSYGKARANWLDLEGLIRIKSRIQEPRHQEDVRILREVRKLRRRRSS